MLDLLHPTDWNQIQKSSFIIPYQSPDWFLRIRSIDNEEGLDPVLRIRIRDEKKSGSGGSGKLKQFFGLKISNSLMRIRIRDLESS
jgi:hypothetical protein